MKKKYFSFNINLSNALKVPKAYQMFLIVLFAFFSGYNSFAQTISSFSPTNACSNSGSVVIITGTGFTGATAVKFNGVTAAFVINSDTQITTTLPSGATTGNIAVTPSSGSSIVSASAFTVNPTVVPAVSIAANTGNSICAGTSVIFTAAPTNGGTTPSYQWFVGTTPVGSNSATYTTSALTNGNQVKVVMTSNATCSLPPTATSNILTMTVNTIVLPSVIIEASATQFCSGTPVTFGIDNVLNGGTTPTYSWKVNGIEVGTGIKFTTSTLSNNDTVTLDLTSSATCAIPAKVSSNDIKVTVKPNLPVSVSISSDDADNTICAGTSVKFTATPFNGGTSPNYQWKVNGNNAGTNSANFTTTTLADNDVVSVVLTSNETCTATNPVISSSITMTVNPNLPVSVLVTASAATICAGTSVTFSATPTNGGTAPTYQWKLNGSNVGTNSASYSTSTLANGDVVTVVLTSNENCITGNAAVSNSVTMTVSPNLTPSVTITPSSSTICAGTTVTFTASATNGGTSPSFQWKLNGNNVGTNSSTYSTSSLINGDIVSVVLTSNTTCTTANVVASNNVTMNVNPNLPVSVAINATATTICAGTSVTFTATPTNGGTIPAYQWKVNGANAGSNSPTFTTSTLTNGQVVTVVLTSTASCATTNPATSTGITMTVNPNLPVSVNISSSSINICAGTNVTFTATPINGGTTPVYQWKVNGSNVGTNSATYSTAALSNGEVVTVLLTSNIAPCATGNPVTSNSITMTVNPLITPSVTITSTSTSICSTAGTSVTFTATPVNGGPTPIYQWKNNGLDITGATSPTYTTTSLASGSKISVVMTSNISCASPATVTSNSIIMTVYTGKPSLPANTISGPTALCPVTSAVYTVLSVADATLYTWSVPTGWIINSGQGSTSINVTATGSATVGNNQKISLVVSNPCGESNSRSYNVDVNTFAAVNLGPDISLCADTSITLSPTLTGNANALPTFTASSGTISGGPYPAAYTYTPSITSGIVTINATTNDPAGSCAAGTDQLIITINQPPSITTQPVAAQTVCSATNTSLSVTATGTGLTYQWRKGTTPLVNGGNISGATSATLNLTNVSVGDAGSYNVVVSGASPCTSVTSSASVLSVNQVVAISSQPAVSQTLCSGNSANFNVTASGTGLLYQWRKGLTNLVNGGSISGATSANLIINPVTGSDSAADYNVVITGTASCLAVTSNNSALVVNEVVAITSQPLAVQTVCSGTTVSFTVAATGTGLNYQWKKSGTDLVNGGNISGATSATLNLANVTPSDAATYTVLVTGASPCTALPSSNAVLNVNQIVAISAQPPVTQTVCSGTSASFSVSATGTGVTYQWRKGTTNLTNGGNISGATSATLTINPVTSADNAADYNVLITGTAPCIDKASNNSALTVNEAVVLTSQPLALQTVCSGTNVSFTVTAAGTGLNYQWKKGATSLSDGGNISGATTATLNLANVTPSDAATYTVLVSGASPCTAIPSSNAVLAVNQIVAITAQPASTQTVCSGTLANLTVSATGTGLTYQWRKGTTNLTDGGSISGATTATLTINPTASGDAASDYNVIITGTVPCAPLTSNNATLVINQAVSIITQPPATQTLCSGGTATLSVNTTGAGLIYQWRKGSTNLVNGANIAGANSSTLTLSNLQTTDTANDYNVVITGTGPCIPLTSNNSILIINRLVTINTQPSNVGVCASNPATFGVVASGDGLTFQWYKGIIGSGVAVVNSANITGANTNVLNFAQAALTDDGPYYAIVSGISPCAAITSDQVTLNIDQSIAITSQPISKTVCEDTANVSFSVTADAGGDPLTYQWRKNGGNITGETAATYTITTATLSDAGNYDVIISGSSGYTCTSIQSTAVLLTISPKPIGSATTQTICSGSSTNVALNSTVSGTTFSWIAAIQTNPTGGTITGFSDSSGNTIAQSLNNTGTSAGTIRYTITPTANSCTGITFTVDVTINPAPVGSAIAQTICSGSTTNVALNSAVTGTTYSWTAAIQTSPTEGTITGFSNGTQNTIVQTLNNTGTTAGIIRYTVTPTANSCSGAAFTVEVTVNPNSTIVLSSGAGSDNPTNCVNTVLNISYAIGGGGTNASITAGALPAGVTGSYNSGTRVYTISGTPSVVGTFNYTVTTQGLCSNASLSGSITVNPAAQVNLPTNQVFCNGSSSTVPAFTTINTIGTTTYSWTNSAASIGLAATGTGNIPVFTATNAGTSPIEATIVVTPTFNNGSVNCAGSSKTFTITIDPNPKGGILSFGATGRIFLSCIDPNPNATVVVVNPVKLDLTGVVGTIVKWEYRTSTAPSWSAIPDGAGNFTGTSLSASQINNLMITASTVFRVEISSGACSPNVYSETAIISVIPTNIKPSPVSANKNVICIGEGVELSSQTGYGESFGQFEGGAFDNSSITNNGWRITDQFGNTNYNFSSDADNRNPDKWLRTNPHDFATANLTPTYAIVDKRWDTSLSTAGNKGFAIVSGNNPSTLETAVFSLGALDEAILTFDQAYNLTPGATIKVEISTNGGVSYTSEPILFQQSGMATSGNYDRFGQGTPGINQMEIDLGDYIGYSNLRVRFSYTGSRVGDIWALDNIKVPEGPRDVNLQWTDTTDPSNPIIIGTTNNVTWTPTKIGWNIFVVKTSLILDSAGNTCSSPVNQEEVRVFAFDKYTTTTVASAVGCGTNSVPLSAAVVGGKQGAITSYPTPDGYVGEWSIQGPVGFVLSNPDQSTTIDPKNNPKAIFTAANLGDYTFNWILVPTNKDENGQIIPNTTCTPNYIGPNLSIQDCTTLDFDGVDDYVDLGTGYTGTYSIEAWIRPYPRLKADGTFTDASKGTIISTKNLEINMSDLPSSVVPNKRWYHIAVDTDGKLYVDGINVNKTISAKGTDRAFIGARWTPPHTDNHFSGWIEEVRIWDGKITEDQIRFTMNQRLQNNANIGVEIPMPAPGFGFGTLKGYFQLLIGTITNGGYTPDNSTIPVNGKLRNMTTWQENTAPLPYTSANDGDWNVMSTWTQPVVWDYPNSVGIDDAKTRIDWNIVKISNNIKSVEAGGKDGITLLGLKSISRKLTMAAPAPAPQNETNTGRMLWITHYLKLDGDIDLVGESQLLQKRYGSYDSDLNFSTAQVSESILEEASLGYIERDQQGQRNSYNYNYWSSPVSIQGGANNAPYSVIGVAKDGTNSAAPGLISFNDGAYFADGALSSPIKTSNRWIWSYNDKVKSTELQNYNQWNYLGSTGFLKTGEGFTMKGTGGTAATNVTQNYVFIGKPNNATISLPLPLNQIYLVGNPYPSALDANEFIRNNLKDCAGCTATQNVFNGTLYFWDHFGVTNNHILAQYTGGYAAYNLSGGVPGIANSVLTVNNNSSGSRSPKRYIPVAQGFFIDAPLGTAVATPLLNFNNNQRAFKRESPESSVFMKSVGNKKTQIIDARSKIRLGFDSFVGIHRQLLVTADNNTTSGYDIGYDAPMFDLQKNDIYWQINNNAYVIQAVNNFNEDQVIPLGITIADKGPITIKIDELENITEGTKIFLFDTLTASYHDIRDKAFSISLDIGEYKNRFSILFLNKTLGVEESFLDEEIDVLYASNYKTLIIQNKIPDTTIQDVYLVNLLGQTVANWDVEDKDQARIQIPIKNFASGVYIVKLKTSTGEMSKKIIIK